MDGDTTVDAKVGDDTKLDSLTIDDHQRSDEFVPALVRGIFGPMSVHSKAPRAARMNLRTGAYEPGRGSVDVDADLGGLVGVFLGGRFRQAAANRVKQESDKLFAATLARAIEQLREQRPPGRSRTSAPSSSSRRHRARSGSRRTPPATSAAR